MGAILAWILRGLQIGGPVAIGYWYNDLATWWSGVLAKVGIGPDKQVNSAGKFAWWFILLLAVVVGIAFALVLKLVSGFAGKKGRKNLMLLGAIIAVYVGDNYIFSHIEFLSHLPDYDPGSNFSSAELLGSIAASSAGTIKLNYLPEIITFNISSAPTVLQIEVTGDGTVMNLDATGATAMNGIRQVGEMASNQYAYQLANGYVTKNTQFTITNAAAAQLDVYGFSSAEGTMYTIYQQAKAFAGSALRMPGSSFLYAAFPSAAATDRFTISWANKGRITTSSPVFRNELSAYLAWFQEVSSTRYNIDNFQGKISEVQFVGAADQTVYFSRMQAVGLIRQSL